MFLSEDARNVLQTEAKEQGISPSELILKQFVKPSSFFAPTFKQNNIIKAFLSGNDVLVDARAGCGKSTTLYFCANQANIEKKGLYIAFNKHTVEVAKKQIQSHVSPRTLHSIALENINQQYKNRVKSYFDPLIICNIYDLTIFSDFFNEIASANLIKETLTNFSNSEHTEVNVSHADIEALQVFTQKQQKEIKSMLVTHAADLWNEMVKGNYKIPVLHEFYLKIFSLQPKQLDVDFILLDEAQDMTPAMMQIIDFQQCQKIIVGDRYQNLYGNDFFDQVSRLPKIFYLNQSFRFGENILQEANVLLRKMNAPFNALLETNHLKKGDLHGKVIICRTIPGLLYEYLQCYHNSISCNIESNKKQIQHYGMALLTIYHSEQPDHPLLMTHRNWPEFRTWAQVTQNDIILAVIEIIETVGVYSVAAILNEMQSHNSGTELLTVNKAKGREWGEVVLGRDFYTEESFQLLQQKYVAITRASNMVR